MRRDVLDNMNPLAVWIYLTLAIVAAVCLFHPAVSGIALAGGVVYGIWLRGRKAVRFFLTFPLIIGAVTVIINGLFVHRGITVLFYMGQNPITLEAVIYGGCAALMMAAVLMWFYCMGIVMTSDKWIYIFGRILPSASLTFSMTMRFIPHFSSQAKKISRSRKAMGCNDGEKTRGAMKVMSVMTAWALENSIDTADSMKARGYGRPGRTAYQMFGWQPGDVVLTVASAVLFAGAVIRGIRFQCYPVIVHEENRMGLVAAGILYVIPVVTDLLEEIRWTYSKSKI